MAKNRYLPLTGGIALTTVYALTCYTVINNLPDPDIQTLDITKKGIILQNRNVLTCPLTLLENDLSQIHTFCGYSVIYTPVPKAVYKITNDLILLSNITQLSIKCENNDTLQIITLNEIPTVHKLHCSCSDRADSFYITRLLLHCDETTESNFTIAPKYIINPRATMGGWLPPTSFVFLHHAVDSYGK